MVWSHFRLIDATRVSAAGGAEIIGAHWIKSAPAKLNPSIGVLAKHVYNLPALFALGEVEILPFRNLYSVAIAEINFSALKVS